jgi:translocation and assembly module TamB
LSKLLRLIGWILAGISILLVVLIVAADSGPGHRFIAKQIAAQKPKSGLRISIEQIDGSIYGATRLKGLKLSDPAGVFFEAPSVALDWRPASWLTNELVIHNLTARAATFIKLPKLRPSETKQPILPDFDIKIGYLEITKLQIEPGIAGERRIGKVSGKANIAAGRALVDLDVDAAGGDRLTLKLDAEPEQNKFDVDAKLAAPAGGVFGRVIGTARPVALSITGDGNWTSWRGSGQASFSGTKIADLALTNEAGRYGLNGRLALETLTKGKLQRMAAPLVKVRGDATLINRRLNGTLALLTDALDIRTKGVVDLAQNSFDDFLVEAILLQPQALFPNMTGRDIQLKARFDGPFARARYDYALTAPQLAFDQTGFDQVRASGSGALSASPQMVPITLTAARVTGAGDVAGGILANLSVKGILQVTSKAVTGDGLAFTSDKLSGKLTLFLDLVTGVYDVGIAGQLSRYLIPGLGIVDVRSVLKVVPGENGKGARVVGKGEAWVRRFDNAFLANLAGGLPRLETDLVRGPDGVLQLVGLKLFAPSLTLSGNGVRRRDGTFQFEGSGQQSRYGPLKLALDGRIDRPKLDILLVRPADALGLAAVRLLLDPDAAGYAWRATGQSTLGGFTGNGAILLPKGGAAVIDIAGLNNSGLTARGRLLAETRGLSGRLNLGGSGLSGTLDLTPVGNNQRIEAHLKARDVRFEGPPVLIARRGQFDGVILLDPAGVTVNGTVTGQGLARGPLTLARLAANVQMRNGSGEVKASFAGSRGRSFDLQTVAQISPNRWQVVGSGTIDRRPVSLAAPALLVREAGGWRLSPTELDFAGGKARVSGLFAERANEFDASLTQMPLAILDMLSPGLGLGGVANGTIAYRQAETRQPSGRAELRIKGLTRAGLVLTSRPVDMGISASMTSGVAGIRAVAVSGGQIIGRAQGRFQPGNSGSLAQRFANAPVFGQIRYNGAADSLWRLTGIETLDVSGPIALGADISGKANDPIIRGTLQSTNARVESPTTGMVLTNVKALGRFGNGSKLVLETLSANAGKGGSISGSGVIDLSSARGYALNLTFNANQAVLLARDDLAATVTGPISIRSDGGEGLISGEVLLNRSSFRLGRTVAAQSVPKLNVREINGLADEAISPTSRARPWRLAIKARAPNRLSVTGLGIESEWRADVEIGGTPFAPVIKGRADLIRGGYEFAGRRFDLIRGAIRFLGESPPDPILDIVAAGDTQGVNATIRVTGTGQRPEIKFASTPALPEDELLARLLFGTSITNLSAPEAVQLAAAVASLQGGGNGLNPINALRNAIGLDRLRILPADTVTGQGTSIAAGKYLTRRTYVEVITDGQGYSATRAEFQITRWLSLLSTISTIGRQSAAVRVSKDY